MNDCGLYLELRERANRYAVLAPASERRRILGKRPVFIASKSHTITVHIPTGTRTVETTEDCPRPTPQPVNPFTPRTAAARERGKFMFMVEAVAKAFDVKFEDLMRDQRRLAVAYPRFAVYRLFKQTTKLSLSQIGRIVQRDHTSIMHGLRQAEKLYGTDPVWRDRYDDAHFAVVQK